MTAAEIDDPMQGFRAMTCLEGGLYQAGWTKATKTGEPVFAIFVWQDHASEWRRLLLLDIESAQEVKGAIEAHPDAR